MTRRLIHNDGTVVRPRGRPACSFSVVPDSVLIDTSLSPTARLILAYVVGKPDGWVVCVTDVCKQLGLTNSQWRTARDNLRKAGVIPADHPKRVGGGPHKFTWVLDLMLERYYLAQSKLSTGHPSKIADGSHQRFPIDGKPSDKQEELTNNKKPPTKEGMAAAFCLTDEGAEERLPGLTKAQRQRVTKALAGASAQQAANFFEILKNRRATARDEVALAVSLAKLAAKGDLEADSTAPGEIDPPTVNYHEICLKHSGWTGKLIGPGGPVATAQSLDFGLLRGPENLFFATKESALFWLRVDAGELTLVA